MLTCPNCGGTTADFRVNITNIVGFEVSNDGTVQRFDPSGYPMTEVICWSCEKEITGPVAEEIERLVGKVA